MHLHSIPEPPGRFLVGNLLQYKQDPLTAMIRWRREYGDMLCFRLGPQKVYLLSHPDLVEQALVGQPEVFVKMYEPEKPKGLQLVLGQGLLTSKGPKWQRQRRLLQPVFQRRNIAAMLPQMAAAGEQLLQRWQSLPPDAEVDIPNEMMRLALEVLTRTMFSTSVLQHADAIGPALDNALRYAAATMMNPFTPPLFVPTAANRAFKHSLAILDEVIYGMIEARRADKREHGDLLDLLLGAADDETGAGMDKKQLRDEMITIFTAGHETTANVLTWTLYLLAKYPQVAAKLRLELQQVLSDGSAGNEQLEQLVYTKAVLQESMRLRPPAGIIMRKISRDAELGGYALKAGGLIMPSLYNIHHHPQLWDDPESFVPERFIGRQIPKYAFLPFGIGSRFCIGSQFAMLEMPLLLAMLMQNFDFSLCGDREPVPEMAVTIRPKGGLRLKMRPIKCV